MYFVLIDATMSGSDKEPEGITSKRFKLEIKNNHESLNNFSGPSKELAWGQKLDMSIRSVDSFLNPGGQAEMCWA